MKIQEILHRISGALHLFLFVFFCGFGHSFMIVELGNFHFGFWIIFNLKRTKKHALLKFRILILVVLAYKILKYAKFSYCAFLQFS